MFDQIILNTANTFIEVEGVLYAPAFSLMELFAAFSAVTMGMTIVVLVGVGVFLYLVHEPISSLLGWISRRITNHLAK